METDAKTGLPLETITYNYTSDGERNRITHIPAPHAGSALALCGDKKAQKFYMWPADYHSEDVTACAACQSHPDLPLILLGGM